MKKRLISVVMVITILFLVGCGRETGVDPTNTTDIPKSDVFRQNVIELASQRTLEYDGIPWIEYDPNRQVYVFTYQYDKDLFPGSGLGPSVFVFSRTPLDPKDISLQMPCQTGYTLQFWADHSEASHIKATENALNPLLSLHEYQYYAMQGIDWKALGQVKALAKAANDLAAAYASDRETYQAYMELYNEYQADYDAYTAEYHAQYEVLKTEDIPQFYLYQFLISFPKVGAYEETIESAELIIAGEKYSLEIGQLRLHKTTPQIMLDNINRVGMSGCSLTVSGIDSSPFSGGYEKKDTAFEFVAEQALTLTGIYEITCGTELGLIGAQVQINDMLEHFWDMQQHIDIEAGASVKIDLYFKDSRIEDFSYGTTAYLLLEYEIRENTYAHWIEGHLQRHMFYWDIYLMAFEGCSIEEYYAYILAPYENDWLDELPEAWLK